MNDNSVHPIRPSDCRQDMIDAGTRTVPRTCPTCGIAVCPKYPPPERPELGSVADLEDYE